MTTISSLVEQRAPYCHARDVVCVLPAENTAALFAGFSMSSEVARLVQYPLGVSCVRRVRWCVIIRRVFFRQVRSLSWRVTR